MKASAAGSLVMIQRKFSRGSSGAGAVNLAFAVIAFIASFNACQYANAQEIAETYTLRSGEKAATVFRVLADQIGIVPADEQPFEDVVESVKKRGLDVLTAVADEQIIIARTSAPARTYAALQEEALRLMTTTGAAVRWAAPVVVTGQVDGGAAADTRDILLPTNVVIVKVRENVDEAAVMAIADRNGLRLLQRNPVDEREYFFESPSDRRDVNVFIASLAFLNANISEYAAPNFLMHIDIRHFMPDDSFFNNQWPLNNAGQNNGTFDADIDADLAWNYGLGDATTIIAVIDSGFDMEHLDLVSNFFVNTGEIDGNGIDDDGNGYVDDRRGWDFTDCWGIPTPGCGDNNPAADDDGGGRHGTMTSGAAAAAGNNARGVSGSCPNCILLPLRVRLARGAAIEQSLAFAYAQAAGADIITNSWGYRLRGSDPATVINAINNANEEGSVIFFAMTTTGKGGYDNDCVVGTTSGVDISSLEAVIAVSASNNADTRTPAGYGDCMEILAPTDNEDADAGTLWPASTDITGPSGYNNSSPIDACALTDFVPPPADARSYTFCANGTSYAAPLTAGVAGLMESLDNTLTPLRHQQILQDTADKIEPTVAAYDPNTGFSSPTVAPTPKRIAAPGGLGSTHGYGRVNAFEAVRLVAPTNAGGRGEIDLFVRDNYLDWGNTEQPSNVLMDNPRGFIPHYASASIKIDAPPYEPTSPTTPPEFVAFPDEEPQSGAENKIYVQVRNRGRSNAANVIVKLLWVSTGAPLPSLPSDFWNVFPANSTITSPWTVIDTKTIPSVSYSGASVAGQIGDGAQIAAFDFDTPAFNSNMSVFRRYCILAVISSIDDPISGQSQASLIPDLITPKDNNITLRCEPGSTSPPP